MPVSRLLPLLLAVMLLCACSVSTPADGVPAEQGTSPASPAPQQLVLPYVSKASLNPLSTTSRISLARCCLTLWWSLTTRSNPPWCWPSPSMSTA